MQSHRTDPETQRSRCLLGSGPEEIYDFMDVPISTQRKEVKQAASRAEALGGIRRSSAKGNSSLLAFRFAYHLTD